MKDMTKMFYILDGSGNPVPEKDMECWNNWFAVADRTVAKDFIGDIEISTVFLGIDHSYFQGPPVLYETMIFGGKHDQYLRRYSNKEQAIEGHIKAINIVIKPDIHAKVNDMLLNYQGKQITPDLGEEIKMNVMRIGQDILQNTYSKFTKELLNIQVSDTGVITISHPLLDGFLEEDED
jgi:hypothetical protein